MDGAAQGRGRDEGNDEEEKWSGTWSSLGRMCRKPKQEALGSSGLLTLGG